MIRLFVPQERADEARRVLDDLGPFSEDLDAELSPATNRLPLWVRVAGGVLVAGLIIGAIPQGFWVPTALVALGGWFVWRARAGVTGTSTRRRPG